MNYKKHKQKWSNCKACELHKTRKKVVLARGKLPADILFIGEAPGLSENTIGVPFCGPAGHLLNHIIDIVIDGQHDYAITNLVCCLPLGEDGRKVTEPDKKCIKACEPRLNELVQMCKPRLIVLLGKLAKKYVYGQAQFDSPWLSPAELHFCELPHPAALLRLDVSQKGFGIQRATVMLCDAIQRMETTI